ncbi:hypothetical protein U732_57 [Clostridium argentinense CDC 2741]|uniref:Helix-turn-helix family protein n=2 Tax=Clostridium argentinense TaxID=29341 RepID=A0A0C1R230_9CLOT|nr:helix-turn-helix transcriptional regulator [Clostridium argentinense]ARC83088.1 transcriptional regulator [Clostridium argentinense]KIE44501.1 hypothetical protein U732_57 [Clostridium argentinense CDC 2741]NFF41360.1 helix-turn-helix transcriptional regulator [Clostridium argentinense]NFP51745.1 helix-turn-helix transcriptional regulator [Clostridium argentinense]NFP74285.1 helix-turn-helix transcriptional regulator [Clostridium argentinense]
MLYCPRCNNTTCVNTKIIVGEYSTNAYVCSACNKIIFDKNLSEQKAKIFEREYISRQNALKRDELKEKVFILDIQNVREKNYKQRSDIEDIIGISPQRLHILESEGINIKATTMHKLAFAIGCSPLEIVRMIDKSDFDPDKHILIIE